MDPKETPELIRSQIQHGEESDADALQRGVVQELECELAKLQRRISYIGDEHLKRVSRDEINSVAAKLRDARKKL
jgi:hypothetical protein